MLNLDRWGQQMKIVLAVIHRLNVSKHPPNCTWWSAQHPKEAVTFVWECFQCVNGRKRHCLGLKISTTSYTVFTIFINGNEHSFLEVSTLNTNRIFYICNYFIPPLLQFIKLHKQNISVLFGFSHTFISVCRIYALAKLNTLIQFHTLLLPRQ